MIIKNYKIYNKTDIITMSYAINGNIQSKSDVSGENYVYNKKLPNALEFILESKGKISSMKQEITYNAYNLIETIKEGTKSAEFYYGAYELRKRMDMKTGDEL